MKFSKKLQKKKKNKKHPNLLEDIFILSSILESGTSKWLWNIIV